MGKVVAYYYQGGVPLLTTQVTVPVKRRQKAAVLGDSPGLLGLHFKSNCRNTHAMLLMR